MLVWGFFWAFLSWSGFLFFCLFVLSVCPGFFFAFLSCLSVRFFFSFFLPFFLSALSGGFIYVCLACWVGFFFFVSECVSFFFLSLNHDNFFYMMPAFKILSTTRQSNFLKQKLKKKKKRLFSVFPFFFLFFWEWKDGGREEAEVSGHVYLLNAGYPLLSFFLFSFILSC